MVDLSQIRSWSDKTGDGPHSAATFNARGFSLPEGTGYFLRVVERELWGDLAQGISTSRTPTALVVYDPVDIEMGHFFCIYFSTDGKATVLDHSMGVELHTESETVWECIDGTSVVLYELLDSADGIEPDDDAYALEGGADAAISRQQLTFVVTYRLQPRFEQEQFCFLFWGGFTFATKVRNRRLRWRHGCQPTTSARAKIHP